MANAFLTPTKIVRESLRKLHQKIPFVGSINRGYDDQYAVKGAKIGSSLNIRLPNQFSVTESATMASESTATDIDEDSIPLTISSRMHVPMYFSGEELTLTIDEFSDRYIDPAMSVLAAKIESNVWTYAYKKVYNQVNGDGQALAFRHLLQAREILNNELVPQDKKRRLLLSSGHAVNLMDALKGQFNDSEELSMQMMEGTMGRIAGFDVLESSYTTDHTTGTAISGATGYLSNSATAQTGTSIIIDGGAQGTLLAGDIIEFEGVYDVHPETKVTRSRLKQFVVTGSTGGGTATLVTISPEIVATGHKQNVSNGIADNKILYKRGAGASELLNTSMAYHKDFCAVGFADLIMPNGVDFSAREVLDGISMRIVRDYDISSDKFPCRIDVLFGKEVIRPEMATRVHADG